MASHSRVSPCSLFWSKRPSSANSPLSQILPSFAVSCLATLVSCLFLQHTPFFFLPLLDLCDCYSLYKKPPPPILAPCSLSGISSLLAVRETALALCQSVFPLPALRFYSWLLISIVALSTWRASLRRWFVSLSLWSGSSVKHQHFLAYSGLSNLWCLKPYQHVVDPGLLFVEEMTISQSTLQQCKSASDC